jgi:hypothetical protein
MLAGGAGRSIDPGRYRAFLSVFIGVEEDSRLNRVEETVTVMRKSRKREET